MARVLATAVGVEQYALRPGRALPGVQESLLDQIIRHAVTEAVAQHLAGLEAQHDRQAQPALTGGDVGDVIDPDRTQIGVTRKLESRLGT